jgi:hypothetical protein
MYDILFAAIGVVFFVISLYDDKWLGIMLNILSFTFFIAAAFHLAAFTEHYYYSYVMYSAAFIALVLAILRGVAILHKVVT